MHRDVFGWPFVSLCSPWKSVKCWSFCSSLRTFNNSSFLWSYGHWHMMTITVLCCCPVALQSLKTKNIYKNDASLSRRKNIWILVSMLLNHIWSGTLESLLPCTWIDCTVLGVLISWKLALAIHGCYLQSWWQRGDLGSLLIVQSSSSVANQELAANGDSDLQLLKITGFVRSRIPDLESSVSVDRIKAPTQFFVSAALVRDLPRLRQR